MSDPNTNPENIDIYTDVYEDSIYYDIDGEQVIIIEG